jgi:chorismate dehydratase
MVDAAGRMISTDGRSGPSARLRLGAVQYLNTRPLVHGLSQAGLDLRFDLPSRLADQLAAGRLDVALIPTVELFRGDGYRVVSDACIACRGPVMSVKLFFRTAVHRVTTLAVDEGSRTSAALARILLAERFGIRPRIETLPIGSGTDGGAFQLAWDLGDEWCRWTGLPFVFAVWAARRGTFTAGLDRILAAARDAGRANLAAIAAAEAAPHGLTVAQCHSYLADNLHYDLGPRERDAVALFQRHAARLGLAPAGPAASSSRAAPARHGS